MARVQAPDTPDPVALRPTGVPGSTFVAAPVTDLQRISSSLGELRPALQQFGEQAVIANEKKDKEEQAATQPLMSNPEVRKGYEKLGPLSGSLLPPSSSELAMRKLAGQRAALDAQEAMKADVAAGNFDWEKGDINAYVFQNMQKTASQFGNDRFALGGFTASMAGFPEKLAAMRTVQATKIDEARRQDNTFAAISQSHQQALDNGASPEQAADEAFKALNATAGPNGSQKIPFAEGNKYLLDLSKRLVSDGKVDAGLAILNKERSAADGGTLPALKDTAAHSSEVTSIIHAAAQMKAKQAYQAQVQAVQANDVNLLSSESGKLATVGPITLTKEDGTQHIISADERKKQATNAYVTSLSPQIAQVNHESPQQTFNRELSAVSNAGVEHPQWKAQLEAAPQAADVNAQTNPAKLQSLLGSANLYDQLREKNPLYLKGLVDAKTRDFYETYRVAKSLPGKTMQEALDLTRRATADLSPEQKDLLNGHYQVIEQQVSSATPASNFWEATVGSNAPQNAGYVQQQVIDHAKLFVRLGLSPTQAIAQAQQAVRDTSTKVNGWVVPNLGKIMPAEFPSEAAAYMTDFVKKNGKLNDGVTAGNIGISYDGNGTFTLVGPNGVGLRSPEGIGSFTLKDLAKFKDNDEQQLRNDLQQKQRDARQQIDDFTKPYTQMRPIRRSK